MNKYKNDSFTGKCPMCGQEFLKERIEALEEGYRTLLNSSDSEMMDGDLARKIAEEFLDNDS